MSTIEATTPPSFSMSTQINFGAVSTGFVDEVPSEFIDMGQLVRDRLMPWDPTTTHAANGPTVDLEMLDHIETAVLDVETALEADGPADPALEKVGRVNSFRSTRPGYQASMVRAVRSPVLNLELNALDAGAGDDPLKGPPPRRFSLRRLLRRSSMVDPDAINEITLAENQMAFRQRIKRIEKGRQWQPDGVVQAVGRHSQMSGIPWSQRPNVRFAIFMLAVIGLAVSTAGPDNVRAFGVAMVERVDLAAIAPLAENLTVSSVVPGL